ncbi:alkali metal cation/H+ antiporter Nha1 C terminus-domain-containing protein [Lipomyces orientalis]|uniref:Alkali metal cation/H+ antiporter Nha1 C terminus-domain-containing protein n=1 Tax=Lipomyces orientalis TaxID=1233043 RepID=A0ACC3THB2_9ASCO
MFSGLSRFFHRRSTTDLDSGRRRVAKESGKQKRHKPDGEEEAGTHGEEARMPLDYGTGERIPPNVARQEGEPTVEEQINPAECTVYQEGPHLIFEDDEGEVLKTTDTRTSKGSRIEPIESENSGRMSRHRASSGARRAGAGDHHGGANAIAYQVGDDIIVEDEEGEVLAQYKINRHRPCAGGERRLDRALSWFRLRHGVTGETAVHGSQGDVDVHKAESSGNGMRRSSSGSGLEKDNLPLQPMARETECGVAQKRPSRDDEEEETAVERKRRLAALKGCEHVNDNDSATGACGSRYV